MGKVLIICGPTATGKTDLALQLAKQFNGELISADSRQVYRGMDIVTGKDVPANSKFYLSDIQWQDRKLGYYEIDGIKLWLVDVVSPNEQFNVAYWHDCAGRVIVDILHRGKLPIVVGVTGLYIKSLTHQLGNIHVPYGTALRKQMAGMGVQELFDWLKRVNKTKARSLNESDRKNPRRLMRAIEIALSKQKITTQFNHFDCLNIGLTGPREQMYSRIDARVEKRIGQGAEKEVKLLLDHGFGWALASMQTSGYKVWQDYFAGAATLDQLKQRWKWAEHRDFRRQLTWFKKYPEIHWFDISKPVWNAIIGLCQEKLRSPTAP